MKYFIIKISSFISLLLLTTLLNGQGFKAGAALRIITPNPLLPISGGVGIPKPSKEKQGDLFARAVVIEKGTPGLSFGASEKKLGWNASPTAQVIFEDCHVPVANRVGAEGDGFRFAMMGLDGGRLNIGACSLGGAQRCLDETIAYTKERQQFGQPVADFQNTQFMLADMATDLEAARALLYIAAAKVTANAPDKSRFSAMAKRLSTDSGSEIVNKALQLFGGYGYLRDYPIERFWRDLRVHSILEGTNQVMRMIIGRDLLRQ
jgi:acyl-CoA dehydrogenase